MFLPDRFNCLLWFLMLNFHTADYSQYYNSIATYHMLSAFYVSSILLGILLILFEILKT
jgi:hypothetical protein